MAYNRGPTREAIPLSPIAFAATAFGLILASTIAAALVRTRLPEHHLTGDSKDVIKLAIALIATMSALVWRCCSPRPAPPSSAPAATSAA